MKYSGKQSDARCLLVMTGSQPWLLLSCRCVEGVFVIMGFDWTIRHSFLHHWPKILSAFDWPHKNGPPS